MSSFMNQLVSLQGVPTMAQPEQAAGATTLRALIPPSATLDKIRWPDARHGTVVTSLAGVGCKAGETLHGAPISAAAGAAIVFSISSANAGQLQIEVSADGSIWLPTDEPATFQVPAGERGAVCLSGPVTGHQYRPAFTSAHGSASVWVEAQNWPAA